MLEAYYSDKKDDLERKVTDLETEVEQFKRSLNAALKDNHRLIGLLEKAAAAIENLLEEFPPGFCEVYGNTLEEIKEELQKREGPDV